jgi:hypothetical protein
VPTNGPTRALCATALCFLTADQAKNLDHLPDCIANAPAGTSGKADNPVKSKMPSAKPLVPCSETIENG